jgi:hypothetical protein
VFDTSSHPFQNLYLWLFVDGGEKNGTHSSLCTSNQANVGWVTFSSIWDVSSKLTTCSFLECANCQQLWPTNSSIVCCAFPTRWPSFHYVVKSTSSRRFKMDGSMAIFAYNNHRSSFPMLLTIRHWVAPCTMGKHDAFWFSNLKKP